MAPASEKQIMNAVYREYYGRDPEFIPENRNKLTIEIQSMFYLLQYFGHYFSYSFSYNTLKDYKMPISMDIQDNIVSMINNHENQESDIKLKEDALSEISIIGKIINSNIINENSITENLVLISSVIYAKTSMLPSANNEEIAKFINCSKTDIDKVDIVCSAITNEINSYYDNKSKSTKNVSIARTIQNIKIERQQPEMRLYGIVENYFESIDDLLKYCRKNKLSSKGLTILDYYRHFGSFNDVFRKTNSDSSIYYMASNEHGICWYSDELNHISEDWEFNHGSIRNLYQHFRDYGVVFEDDIYAKQDEKDQKILEYCKEKNLSNMGNK